MIPRNESNYPLYNGQAKNSVARIVRINFSQDLVHDTPLCITCRL